jgi:copper/silver efflux system protein
MIDRLIDFSARHRWVVLLLAIAAAVLGWQSMLQVPVDVLPDMSDRQVLVYSRWDRSPDLIDAQVTYPIVTALLGAAHVRTVRGISDYGASFVYVVFEDNTDLYWARARTLEYLSAVLPRLPDGVKTEIGPDATSLGWVFQYTLVDHSGTHSLTDLRSFQDWYLGYSLRGVPGVAEVASVGGLVRQFQVHVDPNQLRAYGVSIQRVVEALKGANSDAGGRVVESGGTEFVVRGLGYAHSIADLEEILVESAPGGTPIRIKDLAKVGIGGDFRRGTTDLDGKGETVSGIVVMRQGQNALEVIDRVKTRLREIQPSLPAGVEIRPVYDRSELIRHAIKSLKSTIVEVMFTVVVVILILLWHLPSAAVPLLTIPLSVLIAFAPFRLLGISANIMSLGGIAIAMGALVDASIVVVEQTHKNLERWERSGRVEEPENVIVKAMKQVARPSFFALLVIAVSFLPILALQAEEGRLFKPLAYTKSLAMLIAAGLVVTVDPALRLLLTRVRRFEFEPSWLCRAANAALAGKIRAEDEHPITKRVMRLYEPVVEWSLRRRPLVLCGALVLIAATVPVWFLLGTEFMPLLDEGVLLYMPNTMPGISIGEAQRLLQVTDERLKQFPEVQTVMGKAGRADSATDPAPLSMLETLITLHPAGSWRGVPTWYSSWAPEWAKVIFRHITPDHISKDELIRQMNDAVQLPGVANTWTMPIRGRIDMLSTGIRTPLGIKVAGSNAEEIERIAARAAEVLSSEPGTRGAFAERSVQGRYADVKWNREALARYGITLQEAQAAVQYSIGGENVTTMLLGRERYPVNVRYFPEFRSDPDSLNRVLVSTADGRRQIPISSLAELRTTFGPSMLRNENGLLTGYVYIDVEEGNLAGYVERADRLLRDKVKLPAGYALSWAGQYESILRTRSRLREIIPVTLVLIFVLLYLNTKSLAKTFLVLLAVPFSAIGAVWMLYFAGYQVSIGVWVGLIALLGVDAETGVFMLLYLDQAYESAKAANRLQDAGQLKQTILEGAARRVRPKLMTTATMFVGLFPILWSTGTGSDVMKRIAAPLIGGILTSFLLELIVYPTVYHWWKSRALSPVN